ncbi:ABC transporter ATP-binding protein [Pseudonocardia sp.]|uniref:ABC transporter ATP-binding protein n=1 Tax=Pseudonocardia sp. TaxID=60912 RepID=UPI003D0C2563
MNTRADDTHRPTATDGKKDTVLEVCGLQKTYGSGARATVAIGDVSFDVAKEEFVCVVGPSGCGKTTLLKCMSGLMTPTAGEVRLAGTPVTGPPEQLALVFQDYSRSLMPWLTVRGNIALPLRRRKLPAAERDERIRDAVDSVGLTGFTDHYPFQLSGGMQQRVAIARALAYQPDILLMDEPFASVDAQTRADLEDVMLAVRRRYGVTILFVTHDIDEAVYLADRVVVLTQRPTTVHEVVTVDLPPDRDQVTTKETPAFAHLRAHIYRAIRRPAA